MLAEKLEVASAEEAQRVILALIKECAEGVSDREGEAVWLVHQWDLDEAAIVQGFAEARAVFISARTQPWAASQPDPAWAA